MNLTWCFISLGNMLVPPATPHGPLTQAVFLERMGLQLRVDALTRAAPTEERRAAITDAARRLVDRTGMGTAYQVLGMTSGGTQDTWPFLRVHGDEAP